MMSVFLTEGLPSCVSQYPVFKETGQEEQKILERLLFCSGRQPLISAQGLAFLSQAEDNLSPWAVGPLSFPAREAHRHRDKAKRGGWREIQLQEFSAPQPLTKPGVVGLFGVCDANVWGGPWRAAPLGPA